MYIFYILIICCIMIIGDNMAMEKVKYNDSYIYVENDIPDEEKGIAIYGEEENLDNTLEFKPISDEDLLENTIVDVDLLGDKNEE